LSFILLGTFTAEEDVTLREVRFGGLDDQILTTDPNVVTAGDGEMKNDFVLYSGNRNPDRGHFQNLVFPVPKGTKLFWGVDLAALNLTQSITLIFT